MRPHFEDRRLQGLRLPMQPVNDSPRRKAVFTANTAEVFRSNSNAGAVPWLWASAHQDLLSRT